MNKKSILVVDDSDFDRTILIIALSIVTNFTIIEAKSGEQCLEILESASVDLVLLDILMPEITGNEVLLKIRKKKNPIELPIIMVTIKTDSADIIQCLQCGANDYITKPLNFEVAVTRITTHLKIAELYAELARLNEIAALDAVVTTYNHEINNPLTVAIGCLKSIDLSTPVGEQLKTSLWRIADITKKIHVVVKKREIEFEEYSAFKKMIKLK